MLNNAVCFGALIEAVEAFTSFVGDGGAAKAVASILGASTFFINACTFGGDGNDDIVIMPEDLGEYLCPVDHTLHWNLIYKIHIIGMQICE